MVTRGDNFERTQQSVAHLRELNKKCELQCILTTYLQKNSSLNTLLILAKELSPQLIRACFSRHTDFLFIAPAQALVSFPSAVEYRSAKRAIEAGRGATALRVIRTTDPNLAPCAGAVTTLQLYDVLTWTEFTPELELQSTGPPSLRSENGSPAAKTETSQASAASGAVCADGHETPQAALVDLHTHSSLSPIAAIETHSTATRTAEVAPQHVPTTARGVTDYRAITAASPPSKDDKWGVSKTAQFQSPMTATLPPSQNTSLMGTPSQEFQATKQFSPPAQPTFLSHADVHDA
eukprot:TRINITY_DN4196_c0_g1_i1.p1 TRINITY_DN4196_c0_g1~~TRINITY_DN4196_c0_g1_i1.p1  ORF type:complete len:293 (-),score=32.78 TRINITY_DN4196_c0_g1_i1:47-925(-)